MTRSGFDVGAGDPNTGLPDYLAGTAQTTLSSQPSVNEAGLEIIL